MCFYVLYNSSWLPWLTLPLRLWMTSYISPELLSLKDFNFPFMVLSGRYYCKADRLFAVSSCNNQWVACRKRTGFTLGSYLIILFNLSMMRNLHAFLFIHISCVLASQVMGKKERGLANQHLGAVHLQKDRPRYHPHWFGMQFSRIEAELLSVQSLWNNPQSSIN